jgi:glycosyltransferase involved in cell wall biosynthesis
MTAPSKSKNASSLSVVMIVKDEAKRLEGCLKSVQSLADEIVILDAGSVDETRAIAEAHGARFFTNTDWQGFGRQRQIAQAYATCDYVLMMDADERLDETLTQSIRNVLQEPVVREHAFAVRRRNVYLGQFAYKFGRGERLHRLYARDTFEFHNQTVHESLNCNPSQSVVLAGTLIHHVCESLYHLKRKQLRYALDWAQMKAESGKRVSLAGAHARAAFAFFREYFLHGSVFSGGLGLVIAFETGIYTLNKYMLLWEINRESAASNAQR